MSKLHLSLNVSNLARSVAFYRAFFGTAPHKVRPGYANFDVADPPLKLALNEHTVANGRGALSHLGVLVNSPAEVLAARERLQAAGLATFDETDTTCCFARQDKVWAHDPDGNAWEVYTITDDLEDDDEHDHAGNPLTGAELINPSLSVPERACVPVCCREGLG
jgi:catechol 2,3-dioxygenase-like lactoylglutathione lyase family enzyme